MSYTKISDVIVPEVFSQYVIEQSVINSKIIQSGIVANNSYLNGLVANGGVTINMPFWTQISGADEVLSDSASLTPDKVTANGDIAVMLMRGKAWSANDLAGALAGSDPMKALATMVANWWNARQQDVMISILKGIFSSALATHVNDASTTALDAKLILDSKQILGDADDKFKSIVMHSAVYTDLQKQNVIEFIPQSDSKINLPTYLGYNVIRDDATPVTDGVYSSYLMGSGVFGLGQGSPVSFPATEVDRDSLAGNDILVNRRAYVLHPFGVKWKGSFAGATPTNAELATSTAWEQVYESKNIPMVEIKHILSSDVVVDTDSGSDSNSDSDL